MSTPQTQRDERGAAPRQGYGKLIVAGVIVVVLVILIFQNTKDWPVTFFFWSFSWPAWLMLVIILAAGFLLGLVTSALLRRRRRREARRRA